MSKSKILFISHEPFSTIGNNGKTFLSLFNEFNSEEVALLYSERLAPEKTKFNNYYKITDFSIFKRFISFKKFEIINDVQFNSNFEIKPRRNSRILFKKFKLDPVIKFIRNSIFSTTKLTEIISLRKWIEDFKPTVVFFVGSGYVYHYRILEDISEKYNLPYYIYFTDDYYLYNSGTTKIGKFLHKKFVKRTKKIVEKSEELFVISPKMKVEYEQHFNKKCSILINAVNKSEIQSAKTKLGNPIVFRYFGWLHSNRSKSLGYLGQCLDYINNAYDLQCKLEVYSLSLLTEESADDLAVETIQVCEPISGTVFDDALNSSDFLVHAESFDKIDTQVTMLSISTKIPEYLLSNRCVVAVGPTDLASVNIFKKHNLGVTLTDKKSLEINSGKILEAINNIDTYNAYCQRAIKYCREEFDSVAMKRKLKQKLFSVNAQV